MYAFGKGKGTILWDSCSRGGCGVVSFCVLLFMYLYVASVFCSFNVFPIGAELEFWLFL